MKQYKLAVYGKLQALENMHATDRQSIVVQPVLCGYLLDILLSRHQLVADCVEGLRIQCSLMYHTLCHPIHALQDMEKWVYGLCIDNGKHVTCDV